MVFKIYSYVKIEPKHARGLKPEELETLRTKLSMIASEFLSAKGQEIFMEHKDSLMHSVPARQGDGHFVMQFLSFEEFIEDLRN